MGLATVVLAGAAVVEATLLVVAVAPVVVNATEVEVLELDEPVAHAPSPDPATRATSVISAAHAVTRMVLPFHIPD